jgi:hypothetical protein
MEQKILYDYTHTGIKCPNGITMKLTFNSDRGYVWRCHKSKCCNKSRCSVLFQSFFAERKSTLRDQFIVLYYWLCCKAPRNTITLSTGIHPDTIRGVIDDFYQIMQEDFLSGNQTEEDLKIGKCTS